MIKLKLVLPVKCPLWYLKKRNINWFRGKPIRNCEGSEFLFLLQANNLACYCFTQGGWGQRLLGQRQRTLLPVAQQAGWFSYLNSLALFLKPHGSKSRCRPRWMLHPQGICAIGKENERRKQKETLILKGPTSKPTQLSLRRHYLNYLDQETNLSSAPEAVLLQETSDYKLI